MKKSKFDIVYESIMSKLTCEDAEELFTISVDWADEEKPESYNDSAKNFGVEVIDVKKPTEEGKWPTVSFKGTKDKLEALIKDYDPTKASDIKLTPAQ